MVIALIQKSIHKQLVGLFRIVFLIAAFILSASFCLWAQEQGGSEVIETELGFDQVVEDSNKQKMANVTFEEQQIKQINESLKNVIDENKELLQKNVVIEEALRALRGQEEIRATRIRTLTRQRDELQTRIETNTKEKDEYEKQLKAVKAMMEIQEAEYQKKLGQLETQLGMEEEWKKEFQSKVPERGVPHAYVINNRNRPSLRRLERENEALKNDAAKVHYNLGNVHFRQGQYEEAVEEYRRAVELIPYDAEAHYNLAFVLGEYLNEPKNALKHYQQYLYLRPDAEDILLVKEKIIQARLKLRTIVDSQLDRDDPDRKFKGKNDIKPEIVLE